MSKVFVLGGTGFLGYYTTLELLSRGYQVKTIALPPMPEDHLLPDEVEIQLGDLFAMSDDEIIALLSDCEGVMYAAGVDERILPDTPSLGFFYEKNVLPTQRLAHLAKLAGVKKFVVYGSYFSEAAERWTNEVPDLKIQGYPNTRLLQEQVAFAEGEGHMVVTALRLPHIYGTMPGRTPLWKMFTDRMKGQKVVTTLPGGTTAVTVEQVAEAAVGAMENGEHRHTYAIGMHNFKYADFYRIILDVMGQTDTEVKIVSYEEELEQGKAIDAKLAAMGKERGIHSTVEAQVQMRDLYVDPADTKDVLGIKDHDVVATLKKTIERVLEED